MDIKQTKIDSNGLIEGVNYILTEDNTKIDWRKMENQFLPP